MTFRSQLIRGRGYDDMNKNLNEFLGSGTIQKEERPQIIVLPDAPAVLVIYEV